MKNVPRYFCYSYDIACASKDDVDYIVERNPAKARAWVKKQIKKYNLKSLGDRELHFFTKDERDYYVNHPECKPELFRYLRMHSDNGTVIVILL